MLGNGQTTEVIVGHYRNICVCPLVCLLDGVDLVAIFKAVPFGLVGANSPVEAWVERAAGGALSLEQVVEPG